MKDKFGREIDYLRVSVTDNCNLRCVYCMEEKDEEIKNLQSEKDDLENQVYKLEQELEKVREYYNA